MNAALYILAGPTATGKTSLAMEWAQANNAEIVSADSLLCYRGMDIGTAKPSRAERNAVPHHLIDCAEPAQQLSVVAYREAAAAVVADIQSQGRNVLVTGGSGFYLKSFYAPIADAVKIPATIETDVQRWYENEGLKGLLTRLREHNPEGLGNLDIHNPRRVLPALARCLASGKTLRQLQDELHAMPTPYEGVHKHFACLDRDDEDLTQRIEARTHKMLEAGLIEEVRILRNREFEANASAAGAIGYRETLAYLDGQIPTKDALALAIIQNTRRLVKKQRTWLRHQLPSDTRRHNLTQETPAMEYLFSSERG